MERLGFVEKRRFDQDEDTHVDVVSAEIIRSAPELAERHSLVELGQNFRMDRLQTQGDLELSGDQVTESQTRFADQGRMTFNDDPLERADALSDCGKIFRRDRARIEEAPAVVELDLFRSSQVGASVPASPDLLQSKVDLRGNGPDRRRFRERVFPQVAHEAAPRAFAVREKDGGDRDDFPLLGQFFLNAVSERAKWIQCASRGSARQNPLVSLRSG